MPSCPYTRDRLLELDPGTVDLDEVDPPELGLRAWLIGRELTRRSPELRTVMARSERPLSAAERSASLQSAASGAAPIRTSGLERSPYGSADSDARSIRAVPVVTA